MRSTRQPRVSSELLSPVRETPLGGPSIGAPARAARASSRVVVTSCTLNTRGGSMRQIRLAILAGIGILVLCVVAVVSSLMDYVSHPEIANVHVAPVALTPAAAPTDQAAPPPPAPITTSVPV